MIRNALIAIYILIVLGISAVARASALPPMVGADTNAEQTSALKNYNYQTHVGDLRVAGNGALILVIDENHAYQLRSQVDLTNYVGSKVLISGIELNYQLASQLGPETVDPLPSSGSRGMTEFFVLSISEVTQ